MTKGNEFSKSTNNSSALIAPSRSEIRIELPDVHLPSLEMMFQATCISLKKITHKVSLCSVFVCVLLYFLEINLSLIVIVPLFILAIFSSIASFFIIYNELLIE